MGVLYPEEPVGALSQPATVNPLWARQVATQMAAYPRQQLNTPQQALDLGAGLFGLVPGIGDAMGLAADVNRYRTEPESRTLPNFGLTAAGLLPFVPNMAAVKKFSPVLDESGKPQIFYHGTKSDFTDFRASGGEYGKGIYFSADPNTAGMYASRADGAGGENIRPVLLAMKNPYIAKTRDEVRALGPTKLKQMGYDGIIGIGPNGEKQYVVFDAEQIKSALQQE